MEDLPAGSVNDNNRPYIEELISRMKDGSIPMSPLPCICGGGEDVGIAEADRFDIPVTIKLCRNCGLIRTDPYFTEEALGVFYRDYYRKIDLMFTEEEWIEHERDSMAGVLANVQLLYPESKRGKIFEIGCGMGAGTQYLAEQGFEVIGFDTNIDDARRLFPDLTLCADWENYPEKADILILVQTFEHFRDPVAKAAALRRLVKDEGILFITLPGIFAIATVYRSCFQKYLICSHPWHYTLPTLTYVLRQAGFDLVMGNEEVAATFGVSEIFQVLPPREMIKNIEGIILAESVHHNVINSIYRPQCNMMYRGYWGERVQEILNK